MIYSNLVAFIVVSAFINIKQKSIALKFKQCFDDMRANQHLKQARFAKIWRKFMNQNIHFSHLQDELQDYNHFWSSYLSFVFVFYILLIAFILFMCLFGQADTYLNAVFGLILNYHICILFTLIYFCGSIVLRNTKLSTDFIQAIARVNQFQSNLTFIQIIKVSKCTFDYLFGHPGSQFLSIAKNFDV